MESRFGDPGIPRRLVAMSRRLSLHNGSRMESSEREKQKIYWTVFHCK
jgi:hypothetical protein